MQYFKSDDLSWANKLSKEEWIKFVETQKDTTDKWKDAYVKDLRNKAYDLNLSNPEHKKKFKKIQRTYIMLTEVHWEHDSISSEGFDFIDSKKHPKFFVPTTPIINKEKYLDSKKKDTIGIGFNMDATGAKAEWEAVLGKEVSFKGAKSGKLKITEEQALRLFDYSIEMREKELRKKFGKDWDLLKPNEQIAITAMYYNAGTLIGPNITADIKQYVRTKDEKYLRQALDEVKYCSNPKIDGDGNPIEASVRVALHKRRLQDMTMLSPNDDPNYLKPGESSTSEKSPIKIKLGKTIVPPESKLNVDRESRGRKYYIWRTQSDSKVRLKHEFFEGKIFHVDHPSAIGHPGKDYNCRCFRDYNVPNFIEIKYYSGEIIKKHITNLYDISGFCIK